MNLTYSGGSPIAGTIRPRYQSLTMVPSCPRRDFNQRATPMTSSVGRPSLPGTSSTILSARSTASNMSSTYGGFSSNIGHGGNSGVTPMIDTSKAVEFMPGRLYFMSLSFQPAEREDAHFFSVDHVLIYQAFFADFGPLNLAHIKRFVDIVDRKLADPNLARKRIYFYSGNDSKKRTNSALLIAQFAILRLNMTPTQAISILQPSQTTFLHFHDASPYPDHFILSLKDCLEGFYKGVQCGWYNVNTFNYLEYEHYEQLQNGDWNWVIPNKLVAFSGPNGANTKFTAEQYVDMFKRLGVNCVVRLNKKEYDRNVFVRNGFAHHDLLFPDGGCPSESILKRFLAIVEEPNVVAAVHCKAGLGRTGTLIGAFIIKNHGFTAKEAIGWTRLCRPGSVIGPQQQFLHSMEPVLRKRYSLPSISSSATTSNSAATSMNALLPNSGLSPATSNPTSSPSPATTANTNTSLFSKTANGPTTKPPSVCSKEDTDDEDVSKKPSVISPNVRPTSTTLANGPAYRRPLTSPAVRNPIANGTPGSTTTTTTLTTTSTMVTSNGGVTSTAKPKLQASLPLSHLHGATNKTVPGSSATIRPSPLVKANGTLPVCGQGHTMVTGATNPTNPSSPLKPNGSGETTKIAGYTITSQMVASIT